METRILIPGTYDLPTKGHEAMWVELSRIGRVIVAVGRNATKGTCVLQPLTRASLIGRILSDNKIDGEVMLYTGALVDAVQKIGATFVVRGVRGSTDLEEGFVFTDHFARCNSVPIVFMPSAAELRGYSSSLVRQMLPLASMDAEVQRLLPESVYRCIRHGALNMRSRFEETWKKAEAQGSSTQLFENLLLHYGEARREYHVMEHIRYVLLSLGQLCSSSDLADEERDRLPIAAMEWALWYHDSVENWEQGGSVAASALVGAAAGFEARLSKDFFRQVKQYIECTQHDHMPQALDEGLVVDADLSILGASEPAFDRYEGLIRKEWQSVPEALFRTHRARILRQFLERSSIFCTIPGRNLWENAARANLTRSIARLESDERLPSL